VSVLLDTSIVSELYQAAPDQRVRSTIGRRKAEEVFLSVITIGELRKGVELLVPGRKRSSLDGWLKGLQDEFADRILPVDLETGRIWGEITARARLKGKQIPVADGLIAATALRHGLRVMTRNTRDFAASGVPLIDPWDEAGGLADQDGP